jgi:hypothetical protein
MQVALGLPVTGYLNPDRALLVLSKNPGDPEPLDVLSICFHAGSPCYAWIILMDLFGSCMTPKLNAYMCLAK